MRSIFARILTIVTPLIVSGCGTYIPEIREPWDTTTLGNVSANGILEYKVKEKVYCAIYEAVKATDVPQGWAVQSTLDLQVDETGALNPGLSYLIPFNVAESFTLGLGATLSSQSTREDKFGNYWDIDRLKRYSSDECDHVKSISGSSPLISVELGLTEWLQDAISNLNALPSSKLDKDNTFNQDSLTFHVKFIVITTGTISPSFKLVRFSSEYNGSLASINRTRTHDILLTFGPKFKPGSPNIALSQHFATEFGNSIGGNARTVPPR